VRIERFNGMMAVTDGRLVAGTYDVPPRLVTVDTTTLTPSTQTPVPVEPIPIAYDGPAAYYYMSNGGVLVRMTA
jgi:hypothetical protein